MPTPAERRGITIHLALDTPAAQVVREMAALADDALEFALLWQERKSLMGGRQRLLLPANDLQDPDVVWED